MKTYYYVHSLVISLFNWMIAAGILLGQQAPLTVCHIIEPNSEPREHPLDMLSMKLVVDFEPTIGKVNGKVTHRFRVLRQQVDSIVLDGPGITVKSVTQGKKPARFYNTATHIVIFPANPLLLGQKDSIIIEYEAFPRKGIYFIGWNDPYNKMRKQIWTQGQGTDHRYWIPCYDDANDKLITEVVVSFDSSYKVLSNGTLLSVVSNKNTDRKIWHYSMTRPHALYLLMLGIGKYQILDTISKTKVPLRLWYYPDHTDRVPYIYKYSAECVDFLVERTGIPFPWESYSQIPVADFIYGAMENTTATIFGDFFCVDARGFLDRNYINVNVHELTHQWFGDLITGRSPKHIWLQESFATFYPKLFTQRYFGEDAYQWQRRNEQNSALEASKTDQLPIVHTGAGATRWYQKGSAVLDMLLHIVGEKAFDRTIYHYLSKHAYKNVETTDFYHAFQDTLGLTLDWFFDQWVFRGGEPHYQVSYQTKTIADIPHVVIDVAQIHKRNELIGLFRMPIDFEVHYSDGTVSKKTVTISAANEQVLIPNPENKRIAFVLFDPGSYILKTVTFEKQWDELIEQAGKAPNVIDRYDAVVAMKNYALDKKRPVLHQLFENEKSPYVRAEIAVQLLADSVDLKSRVYVKKALNDKAIEVRKAVVEAVKKVPEDLLADLTLRLQDSSYQIVSTTLALLSESYPQKRAEFLNLTEGVEGMAMLVKTRWLEIAHLENKPRALAELIQLSSNSYDFTVRRNAFDALKRLNYIDTISVQHLFNALLSTNNRLAAHAAGCLSHYQKIPAAKALITGYFEKNQWKPDEKSILSNYLK